MWFNIKGQLAHPTLGKFVCLLILLGIGSSGCVGSGQIAHGMFIIALESAPVTFDPRGATTSDTARVHQLIYHTLVQKNERFELVPELAERWQVDAEMKNFTFFLPRGVTFHNGKELTARDVAYTFETMIAPGFDSPKRAAFSRLRKVEVVDSHTVVFRCSERYAGLLVDLIAVGIIPEGSGPTVATNPIGTGPFRFVSSVPGQYIDLAAFPEAFGGGPSIQRLRLKVVRDPTTLALELLSGSVHFALNTRLSPDFVEEQRRLGTLNVTIAEGAPVEYLLLNTSDPVLADRRVRQAIAYGLDRQVIVKNLLQQQARLASTVLPPTHWAYNANVKRYDYDPDMARRLLDEAGYPDPDGDGPQPRLRLSLKTSSAEQPRQIATIVQEHLRNIGIEVQVQSYEFQTYANFLNRGQYQMGFLRLVGGYFPDIFKAAFGSRSIPFDPTVGERERTGFLNRARYRNAEVDRLIEQAEATQDRQQQVKLYGRIQEIVAEDVPWVYLWYPSNVAVMSRRVANVQIPPSGDFFFFRQVTFQ